MQFSWHTSKKFVFKKQNRNLQKIMCKIIFLKIQNNIWAGQQ